MDYIGKNLKRARLIKELSLKEAGKLLNMSATAVSKYENGDIFPDSKKLIMFADAYDVKVTDLLRSYNTPVIDFTLFRKKKRLVGRKLELLKEIIQDEVSKRFEVYEMCDYNFKSSIKFKMYNCDSLNDAENAACEFRKFLGISIRQPISDLISIIENLGVSIIQIKNINNMFDDFDGLCEIINGVPIIVILDDIKDGARQRFTICHELGHLLLKINNEDDEEKLCNRFASSLLMPGVAIKDEFGEHRSNISFYELVAFKNEFKVSYTAILYRLKDLNIINEYLYKKLSIYISTHIGKNDPNPIPPEKSFHFKKLVHRLEVSEIISVTKACELLGETHDEYNREMHIS